VPEFVSLTKKVDHFTVPFHFIVDHEALCAKYGPSYMELTSTTKIVTEVVNFIVLRDLNRIHVKCISP
jgi:hypothetical protein